MSKARDQYYAELALRALGWLFVVLIVVTVALTVLGVWS